MADRQPTRLSSMRFFSAGCMTPQQKNRLMSLRRRRLLR
jgi:hypothetical protein